MKRTLSFLFAAALLLTTVMPFGASATITSEDKYIYEDFDGTTFNGGIPTTWKGDVNGASIYGRDGKSGSSMSIVNGNPQGTKDAGSTSDGAYSWPAFKFATNTEMRPETARVVLPSDLDQNAMLLSYDIRVPESDKDSTTANIYDMRVDLKVIKPNENNWNSFFSGVRITNRPDVNGYDGSKRVGGIMAEGSHSNGSRFMKLNDTVKGQWVNCKVLVTYDSAADSYCAKYYVDGTLIADGYGKAESTKLRSNTALANGGEGYKFMPYIVGNSTDSNDRIRIDNIILREYGYATMQEDQQIAVGQTEVTVPFANAAFKSDETAPAAVKNAAAIYGSDFSASDITAVRYAADDTFMVNGTEAEVTLVETAADGIKLSVPALGKGEKLKLTVQNCGDFSGAALANRTTVLYNDTADGFLGIELADFDGESKTVGENNTIPAAIKTMKLLKKDTTAALTLTKDGAETADYTATAASGAYTFDFSAKTLTPNTAYTLKSGEDTIAVFTTDAGMLDFGTPTNADGKARIEVRNITNASQEVYLIYAIYAEDESLIRLDYKTETVAAGAVQTMTTDNALTDSEAKTAKVFVWDGFLDINPLAASTPFTLK